jgi:hypothetical protein
VVASKAPFKHTITAAFPVPANDRLSDRSDLMKRHTPARSRLAAAGLLGKTGSTDIDNRKPQKPSHRTAVRAAISWLAGWAQATWMVVKVATVLTILIVVGGWVYNGVGIAHRSGLVGPWSIYFERIRQAFRVPGEGTVGERPVAACTPALVIIVPSYTTEGEADAIAASFGQAVYRFEAGLPEDVKRGALHRPRPARKRTSTSRAA